FKFATGWAADPNPGQFLNQKWFNNWGVSPPPPLCVSFHGNGDFQVDWRWGEWHVGTIIGMEKNA
uniref:hypothetical protein n=1 Tax=Candidatus Cryptobacteroides bacterium TaxID=3085639 RepID=UPI00402720C7